MQQQQQQKNQIIMKRPSKVTDKSFVCLFVIFERVKVLLYRIRKSVEWGLVQERERLQDYSCHVTEYYY